MELRMVDILHRNEIERYFEQNNKDLEDNV